MEALTGLAAGDISAAVLLGIAVLMVLRGDIVPRKTMDSLIEDRDKWRAYAERQQEINSTYRESALTAAKVMNSLPVPGGGEHVSDADASV